MSNEQLQEARAALAETCAAVEQADILLSNIARHLEGGDEARANELTIVLWGHLAILGDALAEIAHRHMRAAS